MKRWKRLKRTVLYQHPRLTLLEDLVRLPDGKEIPYLLAAPSKNDSVSVIALNDKGELLVQRQYSYPTGKVLWELPGGSMEAGETPEQGALREMVEETGFTAKHTEVLGRCYTQNRFKDAVQHTVLCTGIVPGKARPDESEFIEATWVPLDEVKDMVRKGEIQNINMLASLQFLAAVRQPAR